MNVMAILNATPDSFWEGSRFSSSQAIARGFELVSEGASVLDIGGESTRPGSTYVDDVEEKARVIPVVQGLVSQGCSIPISIDTRKRTVMEAAHRVGASWLNDVSALEDDPTMAEFAAEANLTVVLMHRQGHPDQMQKAPHYVDVVTEVREALARRIEYALSKGIRREKLVIDPGFGFGKTLEHSLALFRSLSGFCSLGFPVLVGVSRKSFLGQLSGAKVQDRLAASLAAALAAADQGVAWIRVHDVEPTVQALTVWKALREGSGG